MSEALVKTEVKPAAMAKLIVQNDLSRLTDDEKVDYYGAMCRYCGLDPVARPFEYLKLKGKTVLYANKGAAEQIRSKRRISIAPPVLQFQDGLIVCTVTGASPDGRSDSEVAAVARPAGVDDRAVAIMKVVTKAKRRLTLSMAGLGMIDETEAVDLIAQGKAEPIAAGGVMPKPATLEDVKTARTRAGLSSRAVADWGWAKLERLGRDWTPEDCAVVVAAIEAGEIEEPESVKDEAEAIIGANPWANQRVAAAIKEHRLSEKQLLAAVNFNLAEGDELTVDYIVEIAQGIPKGGGE